MTFLELQIELKARGYTFLTDARVKQFLNDSYQAICDLHDWPFLDTTTSGTAPLTITDLSKVLYVVDTTNATVLTGIDARLVVDIDTTVTTAGTPLYWWLDGLTTLKVYPTSTSANLSVRYSKLATELSADGDTPILPDRFHSLIVDGAVLWAMKDSDDYGDLQTLTQMYQADLVTMADALMNRNHGNPDSILITSPTWNS